MLFWGGEKEAHNPRFNFGTTLYVEHIRQKNSKKNYAPDQTLIFLTHVSMWYILYFVKSIIFPRSLNSKHIKVKY